MGVPTIIGTFEPQKGQMAKKAEMKKEKIEENDLEKEEIVEETEIDEKQLLKQAEEREKERKAEEEAEKELVKEEEKEEKKKERKEKQARKKTVRVKPRHGKKWRAMAEKIEKDKEYALDDAINLAMETNVAKFDATVEIHVALHEKEKNIRGMVVMPGGLVKEKKILEVTESNADEVIVDVKAGKIDFDMMIADIKVMPKLAQLAKVLGPKGLMPSPKAGTAVDDVKKAVAELKGGKVEYRADKFNVIHMPIGKISFGFERIKENFQALYSHLPKRVLSVYLTTTMGPSVKVVKK